MLAVGVVKHIIWSSVDVVPRRPGPTPARATGDGKRFVAEDIGTHNPHYAVNFVEDLFSMHIEVNMAKEPWAQRIVTGADKTVLMRC